MPSAMPRVGSLVLATASLDRACAHLGHSLWPHRGRVDGSGRVAFRHRQAVFGGLAINALTYGTGVHLQCEPTGEAWQLVMAVAGRVRIEQAGRRRELTPGMVALVSPRERAQFDLAPRQGNVVVSLPATALAEAAGTTPARLSLDGLRPPDAARERAIARLIGAMCAEAADGRAEPVPRPLSDALQAALGKYVTDTYRSGDAQLGRPRHLDAALDWLAGRLGEPVDTLAAARAAAVSRRTLQLAFQRHLGTTPGAWVREQRLRQVRTRLLGARPGETVAAIALDCGFTHLGKFAAAYRQRYAESPSATLRARGRTGDHHPDDSGAGGSIPIARRTS